MNKFCKLCSIDPESHSFKRVGEKDNITIFYAKPSAAKLYKDKDKEGIITHIDNTLKANKKRWACIVDADDFDIRHATEFEAGRGIVELLISKYYETCESITVINPTWHVNGCIKFAELFVSPEMMKKLNVLDNRRYSILEFI